MGAVFSVSHAAACAANLPLGSAVLARIDRRYSWTNADYRLFDILCVLSGRQLPYPWDDEKEGMLPDFGSLPVEQMQEWLDSDFTESEEEWLSL